MRKCFILGLGVAGLIGVWSFSWEAVRPSSPSAVAEDDPVPVPSSRDVGLTSSRSNVPAGPADATPMRPADRAQVSAPTRSAAATVSPPNAPNPSVPASPRDAMVPAQLQPVRAEPAPNPAGPMHRAAPSSGSGTAAKPNPAQPSTPTGATGAGAQASRAFDNSPAGNDSVPGQTTAAINGTGGFPGLPGPFAGVGSAPSVPGGGLPGNNNRSGGTKLIAPESGAYGHTLGEWSAAWWEWALSMPAKVSPLLNEPRRETWDLGQAGPVWFFPGTLSLETTRLGEDLSGGVRSRVCQVPEGKAILLPLAAFVRFAPEDLDNARALPRFLGMNEKGLSEETLLLAAVTWLAEHVEELACTIDGVSITNLARHRLESPAFDLEVSDVLEGAGVAPGPKRLAMSDGYWLMIAPPAAGRHTIQFSGALRFRREAEDPFDLEVRWMTTYVVQVGSGARSTAVPPGP